MIAVTRTKSDGEIKNVVVVSRTGAEGKSFNGKQVSVAIFYCRICPRFLENVISFSVVSPGQRMRGNIPRRTCNSIKKEDMTKVLALPRSIH